ncbi:MAG: hypothetical protein ACRDSL_17780 [Pseudonocardiaceae bacterium]
MKHTTSNAHEGLMSAGWVPLSGPELIEWIALRRVCGVRVAMSGGQYLDLGCRVPTYLDDPLTDLYRRGLITVVDADVGGSVWPAGVSHGDGFVSPGRSPVEPESAVSPPFPRFRSDVPGGRPDPPRQQTEED